MKLGNSVYHILSLGSYTTLQRLADVSRLLAERPQHDNAFLRIDHVHVILLRRRRRLYVPT